MPFLPHLRRLIRLPPLLVHVALGVAVINLAVRLDRLCKTRLARRSQIFWCRSLCFLLGIRIQRQGSALVNGPALLACNHVSWLDILVISAHCEVAFLSKAEVRAWPGVGGVATSLGTLYIQRGMRDAAAQTIQVMTRRLQAGGRVLFFPEGTTGNGDALLPFRPRLFQAAIDAGVPVQPLAIRYVCRKSGEKSELAPFVGNQPLLAHVIALAGASTIDACLTLDESLPSQEAGRSELAVRVQGRVQAALSPVPELPEPDSAVTKR